MREFGILFSSALVVMLATAVVNGQQRSAEPTNPEVRMTDSESLWTVRFADCDLGYYVLFPHGFVAHGNHPPNPIHGFLVGLPDTATTKTVTADDGRFIQVTAEYNSLEFNSLQEAVDYEIGLMGRKKSGFKVTARQAAKLDGVPAKRVKAEYNGPKGKAIEEEIVAMRSGIIYELALRTTAENYKSDQLQFAKIVAVFKFWRIHYC
jgi:hypothetical protein